MNFERHSGVLLHLTSLPGRWGMGELGPQARAFGRQLAEAGQRLWQILPTGPVGYGSSPYSAVSAFAGNHLLISLDDLMASGRLSERSLRDFPDFSSQQIDFPAVSAAREKVLFRVADRFEPDAGFAAFCEREADWLDDYALFMALRETQGGRAWTEWPAGLRDRVPAALEQARRKLAKRVRRHEVLQYLFAEQWAGVADSLRTCGITWIGDLPIFVAGDSADVWAHRELFLLTADGSPAVVAGVPPDYFSQTGQRWGNPLYDWSAHRATGFAWWTRRMQRSLEMTGVVRIDHFRGFEAFWEIPAAEPTAIHGRWVKGPGLEMFQVLEKNLRRSFGRTFRLSEHVIAENLGIITEEVEALREACGFPGMWVLQFRFGAEPMARPGYRPEGTEKNWVVYTGTHDNDTTQSWFQSLDRETQQRVGAQRRGGDDAPICRVLAELALRAPAKWAILPLQDVLGLDGAARMNTPGIPHGNWGWRCADEMLSRDAASWLRATTEATGRAGTEETV